jgi:hypothetical protein
MACSGTVFTFTELGYVLVTWALYWNWQFSSPLRKAKHVKERGITTGIYVPITTSMCCSYECVDCFWPYSPRHNGGMCDLFILRFRNIFSVRKEMTVIWSSNMWRGPRRNRLFLKLCVYTGWFTKFYPHLRSAFLGSFEAKKFIWAWVLFSIFKELH